MNYKFSKNRSGKHLSSWKRWFLKGHIDEPEGPHELPGTHHEHTWWRVMCLTGVDYFSTLGYQPGIAFLAAGLLSPLATFILVLLTLFAALPIYRRVAGESPHGEGSISMLEQLLPRWKGKLFVLVLLGFVATDFIITITLSAADAAEHIIKNPFAPHFLDHRVIVTLILIVFLGAVFVRGFKEAIGLAVALVFGYLFLNSVVIVDGLIRLVTHPELFSNWTNALSLKYDNPFLMIGVSLLLFPKLALGLSGFETGVAVMPLVKGRSDDDPKRPAGRIENTKRLLSTAALIMSVLLLTSSLVTSLLIPAKEFAAGGHASGRALAYLAHTNLGEIFGTIYDLSTISILWFAGASAMAGLLNIVPRYLPRYGMAPEWARATRPLVVAFTFVAVIVTILFQADVEAQGGAYATGVLVLMSSAAVAVTISAWKRKQNARWGFLLIALVFAYTTVVNIIERPEGIHIASFFISAIIFFSLVSRVLRSTELRVDTIAMDEEAESIISEISQRGPIRIIANRRDRGDIQEYQIKEREKREDNHIPAEDQIVFFEVKVADASEFTETLRIQGVRVENVKILRAESAAVPNSLAAFLLYLRDRTGKIPHIYFGWTEGNPITYLLRYIAFGEGDVAPTTREVLRQAEHDPDRRPAVHVGG